MHMRRLHVLIAAAALATCTSTKDTLLQQGHSPAYIEGYEDGCASGEAAAEGGDSAEAQKDETRYPASDGQYAEGWNAAFEKCRSYMQVMIAEAYRRRFSKDR